MPPPAVEYCIVFNTETKIPGKETNLLFDILINRCASLALELLGEKKNLSILTDSGPIKIHHDSPMARETLLEALAHPRLAVKHKGETLEHPWNIPCKDNAVTLVFSLPTTTCDCEPIRNRVIFIGPRGQAQSHNFMDRVRRILFIEKTRLPQDNPRFTKELEASLSAFSQGGHDGRLI
jgi:hypothetical protein